MKKESVVERKRGGLVRTRCLGGTPAGGTEIRKAPGEKDLKRILSGEEAPLRRSGDVEKGGMRSGLTEEMKRGQGVWGTMKTENLLLGQMMTGLSGVAWRTTEAPGVVPMKRGSLAVGWRMSGLPGAVQTTIGLPGGLVRKTGEAGAMQRMTGHLDEDWMTTEEAGGQPMRTEAQDE